MILLITSFALLFQDSVIVESKEFDSKKNDPYTSLDTFKKILSEFITVNGGIESLGRAAGSAYQDFMQSSEDSHPYQQGVPKQYQEYYGHDTGYKDYKQQQTNYIYNQNGYYSLNQGNGHQSFGYGAGYGYGQEPYDLQNYYGYQNTENGQVGYQEQTHGLGQENYGHQNYGYGEGGYGQLYQHSSQAGYPRPGSYPIRGYPRPGTGLYSRPQGYEPGFLDALTSITRHDDLRCVPRLLCEVASAGKASSSDSQTSIIPFANKESLVSLLTVLNFVDDSPFMTFGRAALLGYTARGDTRACLQAYPTCPRDPDRLVEYLNNHNGGFFRFFQGAPGQSGPQLNRPYNDPQRYPSGYYTKQRPQSYYEGQYSPHYNQYRILTKPEIHSSILSDSTFPFQDSNTDDFFKPLSKRGKKLSFPKDNPKFTVAKPLVTYNPYQPNDYPYREDYLNPSKGQFSQRPPVHFFPDRTGTGEFLLDYDKHYSHNSNRVPVHFYSQSNRNPKQILFPDSTASYSNYNKMIFPF